MESLTNIDDLYIQQKVDVLESVASTALSCTACEQPNTYYVYDGKAPTEMQQVNAPGHLFTIKEDFSGECSDICCRCCCNPFHPMTMTVTEMRFHETVFVIHRPFKGCGCSCFPCCLQVHRPCPSCPVSAPVLPVLELLLL